MSYPNAKLMNLEDGQKLLEAIDQHKAEKDGAYEDLTAGSALYLLSDRGDTDVAPYVFRKTGGAKNGYGREFLRKIVGGTVAWNQLYKKHTGLYTTPSGITITVSNDGYIQATGTAGETMNCSVIPEVGTIPANHVMLYIGSGSGLTWGCGGFGSYIERSYQIIKHHADYSGNVQIRFEQGTTYNGTLRVACFDLTAMFGSTIADAIYAMEQATAGSGVAWFRSLFPNSYYAYDAGSLQSVQAKEHRLTGFNQWDEETRNGYYKLDGTFIENSSYIASKNPIPVIPSTQYNITSLSGWIGRICWYDANNAFLSTDTNASPSVQWAVTSPANARYLSFDMMSAYGGTYKNDICINLSDPAKNGTYEPYEATHTYPFDSSLTLRGIPKWDSTNGLYYDGDEYKPDGSVKRKYGIVDLGTLTWTKYDTTSGTLFRANDSKIKYYNSLTVVPNLLCSKYPTTSSESRAEKTISQAQSTQGSVDIVDSSYSDAAAFKTAMSGVYLVYELATPTTETADPYRELQISAHGGTEEFIDAGVTASTPTRDVSIPVGTETFYPVDIWHLIDELTALVLEN